MKDPLLSVVAGEVQREVRKMVITDRADVHARRAYGDEATFETPPPGTDGQHISETGESGTVIPELGGARMALDGAMILPDPPKKKPNRALVYQLADDAVPTDPAALALAEKLHNEGLLKNPRPAKFNEDGSLEIIVGAPGSRTLPKLP